MRNVNLVTCQLTFIFLTLLIVVVNTFGAAERDPLSPRVPPELLEDAKAMTNPIAPTPENVQFGKELYEGFALCIQCHGPSGKGDGAVAVNRGLDPSPRNFTNPNFHRMRTDGELFWVVNNGSPGTAMPKMTGLGMITEEQAWYVITYIRTFPQRTTETVP